MLPPRVLGLCLFAAGLAGCSQPASQPAAPAQTRDAAAARPAATGAAPTSAAPAAAAPGAAPAARTTLLGNLGSYHRIIRTTKPDAQKFFDEGLTLLYGFNHEESFRSFQRAAVLDPVSPMPHWGMALALGTNINDIAPADRLKRAYVHLADAIRRARNGSPAELGLVAALAKRYVPDPSGDQMVREQAYSNAMGVLMRRFPADLDVATLYAESLMNLRPWKLYAQDGTPAPSTETIVSTLEGVLRRNPRHPGANHYYIHAVEASTQPERATAAATRLEKLVPGAGHLVHMPAHIYMRTGQYARAAASNADAASVDERYLKATGTSGMYAMMYYGHNLQFEAAAAMFAGNFAQARSAAVRTVKVADPMADEMAMVEPFAAMEQIVLVRFERWDAILAMKRPAATRTLQTVLHLWARGAALAAKGRGMEASTALRAARAAAAKIPTDAMVGPANSAADVAAVAVADLAGRVAEARGNLEGAIEAFTNAVGAEDQLGYNEPPDWLLPEREMLGRALMRAGRPADAENVFRDDLGRNVGNPRSIFGLWKSLEAQDLPADEVKAIFEQTWVNADVTLSGDQLAARQ